MAVLRQVCRNVKHWRDARMALRCGYRPLVHPRRRQGPEPGRARHATAMLEAEKSFRRLKAHKQLPVLRAALPRHQQALLGDKLIASKNLVA
jgi:putative transposase